MNISRMGQNVPLPSKIGTTGRLVIYGGTTDLTVRADSSLPLLFKGEFEGILPKVEEIAGRVEVRYPRFGFLAWLFSGREEARAEIVLKGGIPWEIEVHGGLATVDADLSGLRLQRFAVMGGSGISRGILRLPAPVGTVPLQIDGGLNKVTILRPEGTPLRCSAQGGMAGTIFDGHRPGGMAGSFRMETEDFAEAADRYNVEISGGTSRLRLETWASAQVERRVTSVR